MSTVVQASKIQGEQVGIRVSFLSRCIVGEMLWSAAANITVLVGDDEDPTAMMPNDPIIYGSYDVEVKVIDGVPGKIYKIIVAARTTNNNIYYQEIKLAVLPGDITVPDPL